MSGTQRLISVDSHYRVTVDQLKEAVPSRYRDAIDVANRQVEAPKLAAMQLRGTKPLGLGSHLGARAWSHRRRAAASIPPGSPIPPIWHESYEPVWSLCA